MTHAPLDLATLSTAQKVTIDALKSYVCELEQHALDAGYRRDYQAAKLHQDWAFAADLCVHKASAALGALLIEALDTAPLHHHQVVRLPNLERPGQAVEVAAISAETTP